MLNLETPILTIISEMISINWDGGTSSLSTEFRYYYSIDGTEFGFKAVDATTRVQLLKLVFEIADELSNSDDSKVTTNKIESKIHKLGETLYKFLIPDKLRTYLSNSSHSALLIRTTDNDIPWELLCDKDGFISERIAFGREVPKGELLNYAHNHKGINICLIGNPTGDLLNASKEVNSLNIKFIEVLEKLKKAYGIDTNLVLLENEKADKATILFDILASSDIKWDIIHYAGHAKFYSNYPDSSSLVLSDGEIKAFEVESLGSKPMVFINACYSGLTKRQNAMTAYGLLKGIGPSFIRGGALGYIGSLWPVSDKTAQLVAEKFYFSVLDGAGVGEALLEARKFVLEETKDLSVMGYVLYGNPMSRLSIFEPALTDGPFVNELGFERIVQLETEYSALEILLVNDLPWIFWSNNDFYNWIARIPTTESQRRRMQNLLLNYRSYFRELISNGVKKFVCITNWKMLLKYLSEKNSDEKLELLESIKIFSKNPNFTFLVYEGDDTEIEEIELVSKHEDIYSNLHESVYVFNKQVRFEHSPPSYSVHLNFNANLIKEYADIFYRYYEKTINQYKKYVNEIEDVPLQIKFEQNANDITLYRLEKVIFEDKLL